MKFEVNNWSKLKDSSTPKLLIIGCSDSKQTLQNQIELNLHNYDFGPDFSHARNERMDYYNGLLDNPDPVNYFDKNRNGNIVHTDYFQNSLNVNFYQALNLYGSNGSPFYNVIMKELYRNKIDNNNLHLLIVSGLYGILKYNDRINDYHLNIDKGPDIWDNSILLAVNNYIKENNIDNDAVFYSLSNNYLDRLNPVNIDWTNLWNNYGHGGAHGHRQAEDLIEFLNNL
jgi:cytoplasmic iron level regulating protein YaaA (DUF328/UPF0246 family)